MRKYIFPAIIIVASFAIPVVASAQARPTISGTVTDSSRALSFATVRILKTGNTVPLQTVLTDAEGKFSISRPANGTYLFSFSHTGYTELKKQVQVDSATSEKLGTVVLSKSSSTLSEVVVRAQKPLVEQSDDKVIFNVEEDPASKTETAIDILRKTPFITVDGEDNIKVNGKSNFKVLLNGRETSMFARNIKEALRGFPGTVISKIEVITNPSAKYDGEGIGGLINIITKKKVVGYNGTLSTFNRTTDKVNFYSLNGNAKFSKIGISVFMNKGWSDPISIRNTSITTPLTSSVYTKRTLDGDLRTNSGWNFGNAELSWDVDSLHTISVYTNLDGSRNTTINDQLITTEFSASPTSVSAYNLYNKSNNPGVSVGSDFIKHFKSNKEREFSVRFLGSFGRNKAYLSSVQENPGAFRFLVNNSKAINNEYTFQADNSMPLKLGKFDAGVKAIMRRASSDFESLVKYDALSEYKLNPANTNNFSYRQDVVSIYSMLSFKIQKSSFRVGMRAEYTNVNGNFASSNTTVKNDYISLLPNIQFSRRLSQKLNLVINYNKRLSRPYIYDLNPFVYNNDSLNITYGNPGLGPQNIHALSTQLRYTKGSSFAGINLEASYSGDRIMPYASFDPQTGVTKTTSLNIGREFQSSVNLNMSTKLTPKLSLFLSTSVRYIHLTNNTDASQTSSGLGGNINVNLNYKFSERFNVATFVAFWQEPKTIQTKYPLSPWHNVSFNYKLFQNKINVSLRAVSYMKKTRDFETITENPNFYNSNTVTRPRRSAVLALTWNFGKLKENVSKKKGVSNDDLLSRPATTPAAN